MPIYEYECLKCGKKLEVIQKFSDKPLNKCPECKGKLHKLISHNSFILKGTGWYATDYSSHKRDHATKTVNKSDTKTEKKVETPAKA